MSVLAAPDGEGGTPVAFAGEGPVHVVLEPVAEAAPLYMLGDPVYVLVLREQFVEHGGRPRVPGLFGVVEQGRPAAPAVGVGVLVFLGPEQEALLPYLLDETGVGLLAVGRGGVYEAGPLGRGDVVPEHDRKEVRRLLHGQVVERAAVFKTFKIRAFTRLHNFVVALSQSLF